MQYICVDKVKLETEFKSLLDLSKPPQNLYIAGDYSPNLVVDCAAIVGSRQMTNYGRQVIEQLVPNLVYQGKTIVSGFMYGVDQHAHQVCLDCGGKTIAVLGWGIEYDLDGYDAKLARDIINSGGLLVSEWKTQKATLWTFPVRNRIVAAISKDVYIVEAAEKSGSLLTADIALKLNRNIWAVPGPITSKTSFGTNSLIASGKAKPWFSQDNRLQKINSTDPILKMIAAEPLSVDEIARKLNQSVAKIGANISILTITGELIERDGKYYINHAN